MQLRFIVIISLIMGAVFLRLIPHPPNFVPIAAIALFGGCYIADKRLALLLPLLALLISDLFLGFHGTMLYVYSAMVFTVVMGHLLAKRLQLSTMILASLSASIIFFLVTNFGVWLHYDFYPKTVEGLLAAYIAAIPFFHYTVLGDLFYTSLLFGIFYGLQLQFPKLKPLNN